MKTEDSKSLTVLSYSYSAHLSIFPPFFHRTYLLSIVSNCITKSDHNTQTPKCFKTQTYFLDTLSRRVSNINSLCSRIENVNCEIISSDAFFVTTGHWTQRWEKREKCRKQFYSQLRWRFSPGFHNLLFRRKVESKKSTGTAVQHDWWRGICYTRLVPGVRFSTW